MFWSKTCKPMKVSYVSRHNVVPAADDDGYVACFTVAVGAVGVELGTRDAVRRTSTSWAQGGALAIWTGGLDWTWTGRDLDWTGGWAIAGADGGLGYFKLRDPGGVRRQDSAAGGRAD